MSSPRQLGFVAAAATLLAAAPLSTIFQQWTWLLESVIAVALVAGVAALVRWARGPLWAQALAMAGTLLLALTALYSDGESLLGIVPTPHTFDAFGSLLTAAAEDMRTYGVRVPDRDGLLFIAVLGVGAVAILVDLLTVALRRPALAGLPMLAIYSVPLAVYTDSVPPVPFVIGAAGFLWLLVADNVERVRRFGRRYTGDGQDVEAWEPSPLAAAGRRLAVVGVIVAVLLPLAVPGMTTGVLSSYGRGVGNGAGAGQGNGRVNLFAALSGQLNQSQTQEMVRVTTNDPSPGYLRFGVADDVTSEGFRSRSFSGRSISRPLPDPREERSTGVTRKQYQARVEITEDFDVPMLPVYVAPVSTDGIGSAWFYDPTVQVVFSNRARSKGMEYSFAYVESEYSPAALRTAEPLPATSPIARDFTRVPQARAVDTLVADLTSRRRTEYDKVRAIYDYFSAENGFRYSLQTETGTSGSEIVSFLNSKVGFCQQYAAAMAWLVRAAGIPARVAFGFTAGSARDGQPAVLTNRNLHAWTEVYFDGFGWVPFDATPAASVPGSTRSAWAPDIDAPAAAAPRTGATAAPDTAASADTATGGGREFDPDLGTSAAGGPVEPAGSTWPWWTAAGILLALALLAVPAVRRELLRRRRAAVIAAAAPNGASEEEAAAPGVARVLVSEAGAAGARRDAHAAWDELIDTMVDFGVPVDPAETPRATADRLASRHELSGPAVQGARLLGHAEERARYARAPLAGGGLGSALAEVRRELAAHASRRTRIVAVVLPPSILLRWRSAAMEAYGRAVETVSQRREALGRWSPRRLLSSRVSR